MTTAFAPAPGPHPDPAAHRPPGESLHVGLIAPPWIPVPPPAYGGIEQVVAGLARGLRAAGDRVTLVAAPGSRVDGVHVVSPLDRLPEAIGSECEQIRHVLGGIDALAGCDVVVDHSGLLGAVMAGRSSVPALHVLHGRVDATTTAAYTAIGAHAPQLRLVAISRAQMHAAPHLAYAGVCHNGLDLAHVPFSPAPEDFLVFLGRMSADKGAAEAIEIARRAGLPLKIAAKCREPEELAYFRSAVEPRLGRGVEWLGEIGEREKYELLCRARALLFPIAWEEPFGMVMIESMACGTPVLATPRGAVPEVVVDGVTGFIRADPSGLADAVEDITSIDRRVCRAHVAARFSVAAMTASYRALVTHVLGRPVPAPRRVAPARRPALVVAHATGRMR